MEGSLRLIPFFFFQYKKDSKVGRSFLSSHCDPAHEQQREMTADGTTSTMPNGRDETKEAYQRVGSVVIHPDPKGIC